MVVVGGVENDRRAAARDRPRCFGFRHWADFTRFGRISNMLRCHKIILQRSIFSPHSKTTLRIVSSATEP